MLKRLTLAVLLSLIAVTTPATAGTPRLRRMVVVGDSLLAGFGSGGFVVRGLPGQVDSTPAVIARRAHVRLPQPVMSRPGVPPQLRIVDANGNGRLDRGEVRRTQSGLGFRSDPDKRVRNLAVPGEDTASVFERISSTDVAGDILSGDLKGRDALKFLILGLPLRDESVSQITRARDLRPTFILVWLGNNDVLDAATGTNPARITITPDEFGRRFRMLLDQLADTGAGMAVANLPDPTGVAALRRAAGDVTACRTPAGALQPVAADDLLSIDMDPAQLPNPPCGKVLDTTEHAQIRATVSAFNAEIAAAIAATEQARGVTIASVDTFARFDALRDDGVDVDGNGTTDLTTRYLGGIFSLDGIHPTRTGYAIIANAFIDAINARFGETIPPAAIARVAARDPLTRSSFRPAGEPPFGLIGEDSNDELESFFSSIFDDVEREIDDLVDDLRDLLDDIF